MQLVYDTYFDSLFTGSPVARSLLHTDPWDTSLLDVNSQYLAQEYVAGRNIIVAPIVYSEQDLDLLPNDSSKIYLPRGSSYYAFNLHLQASSTDIVNPKLVSHWIPLTSKVEGGIPFGYLSSIDRYANGDVGHLPYLLPIFVREGAIFPTIANQDYTGQSKPNPLTIHCYPINNTEVVRPIAREPSMLPI
jgi:alpha-glucosidase (family GH31 glycosyl hydrolase)